LAVPDAGVRVYIASLGEAGYAQAVVISDGLRRAGVACDIDFENKSLKSQMRNADKTGAGYVLIIGDEELANVKRYCETCVPRSS